MTKRKYNRHTESCVVFARVPKIIANKIDELTNETNCSRSDIISIILNSYFKEECPFDTVE